MTTTTTSAEPNAPFDVVGMRKLATLITPFAGEAVLQYVAEIERLKAELQTKAPEAAVSEAHGNLVDRIQQELLDTAAYPDEDVGSIVERIIPALVAQTATAVSPGWYIAETGGGELVVRSPQGGSGSMTIPANCEGSLPVRLLDTLGRALLATIQPGQCAAARLKGAPVCST